MKRGILEGIIPDEIIKSDNRNWNIILIKSLDIWCEFAFSENIFSEYRDKIKEQIIKSIYPEDDFDRFPIYYISTRPKTRFLKTLKFMRSNRRHIYLPFIEGIIPSVLSLEVEHLARIVGIDCSLGIKIFVDPKYLICFNSTELKVISIYDLLYRAGYKFKFKNSIQYIGYTENPDKRPFSGTHAGLTQILYDFYDKKKEDAFINYQQFHVTSFFVKREFGIVIQGSNTMLNEIDIKTESKIIEASLIRYYIEDRRKNYRREMKYLKNRLSEELSKLNIKSINYTIDYDFSKSMFKYKDFRVSKSGITYFNIADSDNGILLTTSSS
jgi:hypothetical protein